MNKLLLSTALMLALGNTAFAQDAVPQTQQSKGTAGVDYPADATSPFQTFDYDKDGSLSQEEFTEAAGGNAAMFDMADTNADGMVDEAEYDAAMTAPQMSDTATDMAPETMQNKTTEGISVPGDLTADFARFDDDNDGSLTMDEFVGQDATREAMFSTADRNGDGMISQDEYAMIVQVPDSPSAIDTDADPEIQQSQETQGVDQPTDIIQE